MNTITVKRIANNPTLKYCIGKLYINGVYVCDTIEDYDRMLDDSMSLQEILKKKVKGQTAIPTGTYKLSLKYTSQAFKNTTWAKLYGGIVPRVLNVKGYDGILIHPGNTPADTFGCLLVGENKEKGKVINSQITWKKLMSTYLWPNRNEEWIIKYIRAY